MGPTHAVRQPVCTKIVLPNRSYIFVAMFLLRWLLYPINMQNIKLWLVLNTEESYVPFLWQPKDI